MSANSSPEADAEAPSEAETANAKPAAEAEAPEEAAAPEAELDVGPGPFLLDTNVLVYATNEDSPFFPPARRILDAALAGELDADACVTPQILAEYYAVITDPRRLEQPLTPGQARRQIEALLDAETVRLLVLQAETTRRTAVLGERYAIRAQEIYDAQVVAAMLAHGVPTILTGNEQDFQRYSEIDVRNPFEGTRH